MFLSGSYLVFLPARGFLFAVLIMESLPSSNYLNLDLHEDGNHIDMVLNRRNHSLMWNQRNCDDCDQECPDTIRIAWQKIPPFIDNKISQKGSSAPEVKGVFVDILKHAFRICCYPDKVSVQYTHEQNTTRSLHDDVLDGEADVILPVHSDDKDFYGGKLPYIQLLTSPGFMLIRNKEDIQKDARMKIWKALAGTWTILVPSILLVLIAGVCIWALEFHINQGEFPKEFMKGASNGIWWALVSMTTVGYGDKTPKTFLGRLFGMLWILFGLLICSFMVATFESALTVTATHKNIEIFGQDIAVTEKTEAYVEAVHQGARVKVFPSFQGAYAALMSNEVFGILEEIPFGTHHLNSINDSRLVISRLYMRDVSYGIALYDRFPCQAATCLRQLFKFRNKDIFKILEHYYYTIMNVKRSLVVHGKEDEAVIPLLDPRSPFYKVLLYALAICLGIMLFGGLIHQFLVSSNHSYEGPSNQKQERVPKELEVASLKERNIALEGVEIGNNKA